MNSHLYPYIVLSHSHLYHLKYKEQSYVYYFILKVNLVKSPEIVPNSFISLLLSIKKEKIPLKTRSLISLLLKITDYCKYENFVCVKLIKKKINKPKK